MVEQGAVNAKVPGSSPGRGASKINMIQALLLDGDGVTLKKQGYFSEVYSKEYGVPLEKIIPFFKNEFRKCQLGHGDVKDVLPAYLKEWGWEKSVDDFLQYWFASNTVADEAVLQKVQELRSKDVKCYLVTDQEKYRAQYSRQVLGFDKKFDGCFFSCELGVSKADPEFFKTVISKIGCEPDEVVYLDDEEGDVEAAKKLGVAAKLYSGVEDLKV